MLCYNGLSDYVLRSPYKAVIDDDGERSIDTEVTAAADAQHHGATHSMATSLMLGRMKRLTLSGVTLGGTRRSNADADIPLVEAYTGAGVSPLGALLAEHKGSGDVRSSAYSRSRTDELRLRFAVFHFQALVVTAILEALHYKCYKHKGSSLGFMLGGSNNGAVTAAGSASQLSQAALTVLDPAVAQRIAANGVQQVADLRSALRIANISTDMACKLMTLLPTVAATTVSGETHLERIGVDHAYKHS
jgi:hypothetical protein